jgi:hypothetical protein
MEILARKKEQAKLQKIYETSTPQFIAVYGRRRVGKTYLVKNFFEPKGPFFHITGVANDKKNQQIWNFMQVYKDVFKPADKVPLPNSWAEAFHILKDAIESYKTKKRIVLFFDELPWLNNKKSGFVNALSYLWNRYLGNDPRVILVVCGSAASWMIKNIIDSKGGLYNRLTGRIKLLPFNLSEAKEYLEAKRVNLSNKQLAEVYMAIGGVAHYLDNVVPGKSSAQIISEVCFDPSSPLSNEFDRVFKSLFSRSENHVKVIRVLASKRSGMNRTRLFNEAGITSGSVRYKVLTELTESGFISECPAFGKGERGSKFRLSDEYSVFYQKWGNKIKKTMDEPDPKLWLMLQNTQQWKSWAGFAFESLCKKHIRQIAAALGIGGIFYSVSTWEHKSKDKSGKGTAIDLLIDRADNCINLCEIKFHSDEFVITKDYAEKLLEKKNIFIRETNTKKTVFITMISSYGVKENSHYNEVVTNQLTLDVLFG